MFPAVEDAATSGSLDSKSSCALSANSAAFSLSFSSSDWKLYTWRNGDARLRCIPGWMIVTLSGRALCSTNSGSIWIAKHPNSSNRLLIATWDYFRTWAFEKPPSNTVKIAPALMIPCSRMERVPAWSCAKGSMFCDTALEVDRSADIKPVDARLPQLVDHMNGGSRCIVLLGVFPWSRLLRVWKVSRPFGSNNVISGSNARNVLLWTHSTPWFKMKSL